jgi:hypothetical protein
MALPIIAIVHNRYTHSESDLAVLIRLRLPVSASMVPVSPVGQHS